MYRILLQNTPLDMQAIMKDAQAKNITDAIKMDETITSDKTGYAYFNDLFVKRHKKILWRYSKKLSLIIIGVALVIGIGELFFDEVGMIVQKFVLDYLPYFIFILYSFNSSKSVVQAMFRNCDHSMLTYSFYRRPEVILSLFRLRLRSLILIKERNRKRNKFVSISNCLYMYYFYQHFLFDSLFDLLLFTAAI